MNCRGERRRQQIVNNYYVKPIAHLRLLNGQTKRSDAEANLSDTYYIFECKLKSNVNNIETIICGSGAGKHFLQLLSQESPALFDPLKSHEVGGSGAGGGDTIEDKWDSTAKQLYNAIQWLIICWDIIPRGPMIAIKEEVVRLHNQKPTFSQIKAINTILSKDHRKRKLTEMINEFSKTNEIKRYEFDLLTQEIEEKGIDSYF